MTDKKGAPKATRKWSLTEKGKQEMSKKFNVCFSCGQVKRPILYLNDVEKMELDRLLSNGDWRAWAKKVLEHSEPKKHIARQLLHETVAGKLDPEDFARRSKELSSMQEDSHK